MSVVSTSGIILLVCVLQVDCVDCQQGAPPLNVPMPTSRGEDNLRDKMDRDKMDNPPGRERDIEVCIYWSDLSCDNTIRINGTDTWQHNKGVDNSLTPRQTRWTGIKLIGTRWTSRQDGTGTLRYLPRDNTILGWGGMRVDSHEIVPTGDMSS